MSEIVHPGTAPEQPVSGREDAPSPTGSFHFRRLGWEPLLDDAGKEVGQEFTGTVVFEHGAPGDMTFKDIWTRTLFFLSRASTGVAARPLEEPEPAFEDGDA